MLLACTPPFLEWKQGLPLAPGLATFSQQLHTGEASNIKSQKDLGARQSPRANSPTSSKVLRGLGNLQSDYRSLRIFVTSFNTKRYLKNKLSKSHPSPKLPMPTDENAWIWVGQCRVTLKKKSPGVGWSSPRHHVSHPSGKWVWWSRVMAEK